MSHHFIFTTGTWIGQGTISLSTSPEVIKFYTKWHIEEEPVKGYFKAKQIVEMEGVDEHVVNFFTFQLLDDGDFAVMAHSDLMGTRKGKGSIDTKTFSWEFSGDPSFEGLETYELQDNGDYLLHAEYSSDVFYRTIVEGRLWKKT